MVDLFPCTLEPQQKVDDGVTPVYDAAATTAYIHGAATHIGTGDPTANVSVTADDGGLTAAAGDRYVVLSKWANITPGVRSITKIDTRLLEATDVQISSLKIVVFREDDSAYTLIAESEDFGPQAETSAWATASLTPTVPISVTMETGKTYFYGLMFVQAAGGTTSPAVGIGVSDLTDLDTNLRLFAVAAHWNAGSLPKSTAANQVIVTKGRRQLLMRCFYTSNQYLEFSRTINGLAVFTAPVSEDDYFVIKMTDVVVPDTKKLTIYQGQFVMTSAQQSSYTHSIDCGNTTPGTDLMTFNGGGAITIPTIGGTRIAGKKIAVIFNRRLSGETHCQSVFHSCTELETAWHNAYMQVTQAGAGATRGYIPSAPSAAYSTLWTVSGTGCTVGTVEMGVKPVIMFGDSQTFGAVNTGLNTAGLGGLPAAFTKPRIWIQGGVTGRKLFDTWLYHYKSVTPGEVDLCEFRGTGCLWLFCGIGVNDAANIISTGDGIGETKRAVSSVVSDVAELVSDILSYDYSKDREDVAIIGLPPYSTAEIPSAQADAVRWMNRGLMGIALACKVPFYNPWLDCVLRGTEGNDIPTRDPATSDDGLHYSSAGGTFIRPRIIAAIEGNTIDIRDAWDN